ncbi:unnamed protein product [Merluccius merluccius]
MATPLMVLHLLSFLAVPGWTSDPDPCGSQVRPPKPSVHPNGRPGTADRPGKGRCELRYLNKVWSGPVDASLRVLCVLVHQVLGDLVAGVHLH